MIICSVIVLVSPMYTEADTHIFPHLEDIVKEGCDKVTIRIVDTNVVVASQRLGLIQLLIAYGVGKHVRFLAAHEIATSLGPSKCRAPPFFHALSGCDQRPCKISQLSPKREIALSAVPWYRELELMLLPSIKYDFTILRRVIMLLILLKTIHTLHHKNQKKKY